MRACTKFLVLTLLVSSAVYGQGAANLARGFDPGKVYQIGDLDHVNLFNGNLIIDIPIGPTYSVGGNLKYGFHLVYNGNPWDYLIYNEIPEAMPSRFNNVAIGWQLTLGELVAPKDPLSISLEENGNWIYVGPDASMRPFYQYLHNNEQNTSYAAPDVPSIGDVVGYTRDSTYLRLVRLDRKAEGGQCRSQYAVQFPNGDQHTFESVELGSCSSTYDDEAGWHYRLSRIEDSFGNSVALDYSDASSIKVSDSANADSGGPQRTHTISLAGSNFYQYQGQDPQVRMRVTGVTLAADPGAAASSYSFRVTGDQGDTDPARQQDSMDTISLPCGDRTILLDAYTKVIFLKSVTRPDGSQFLMASSSGTGTPYYTEVDGTDSQGNVLCSQTAAHISRMDLPTGGHIAYTEAGWRFPNPPDYDPNPQTQPKDPEDPNKRYYTRSIGIASRQFYQNANDTNPLFQWTYEQHPENFEDYKYGIDNHGNVLTYPVAQEEAVCVTDPVGRTTTHYFDVLRDAMEPYQTCGAATTGDWWKYGLPFTRSVSLDGLYLSTESFDGKCSWSFSSVSGSCERPKCLDSSQTELKPKQRTYVVYEEDVPFGVETDHWGPGNNSRVQHTRTAFLAADGTVTDTYDVTSTSSDFDGLGHYRGETASAAATARSGESPIPPMPATTDRQVYTHFNANTNAGAYASSADPSKYMIATGDPWLTGLYDYVQRTLGTETVKQEFTFDRTRGFLSQRRDLQSASGDGCNDVIVVYDDNVHHHGDVEHESYFGGDADRSGSAIALPAPCSSPDLSSVTPVYGITHTYAAGALKTTSYDGSGFNSEDYDISSATGLVTKSRDSAGQATSYTYDSMFRIQQQDQPAGGSSTAMSYSYSPLSVTIDRKVSTGDPANPGSTVGQNRFYYDNFGRMVESKVRMPDNGSTQQWATVVKKYDGLGRATSVSQPVYTTSGSSDSSDPSSRTIYSYDFLGRTISTTMPDGTQVTQAYTGARKMERSTLDANGNASPSIGTTANTVVESYDGHGHLAAVAERSGQNPATDNPVVTSYTYDAANHLNGVSTTYGATTQTRSFAYDDRGWLSSESYPELNGLTKTYTNVDARGHAHTVTTGSVAVTLQNDTAERVTSISDSTRVLKAFTYATANVNLSNPTRTNYVQGRLDTATRHNYFSGDSSDVTVADQYEYDVLGRVTRKTTSLMSTSGGTSSPTQSLVQTYAFDAIDDVTTLGYPAFGTDHPRSLAQSFSYGFLTGLSLASQNDSTFTYFPTGMVQTAVHADSTTDTVTADHNMARPATIGFSGFSSCSVTQPVITVPSSVCGSGTGSASVPLVQGTAYSWSVTGGQIVGTGSDSTNTYVTFTAASSGSVTLTLTVTNNCGSGQFASPSIPITALSATVSGSTTTSPNVPVQIQAALTGTAPWTVNWSDGYQQTVAAGSGTVAYRTVTVSATTDFSVTTVTDGNGCTGSGTGTAHITVVVPAPGSIQATVQPDGTTIHVTWPAVNYATYNVYRDAAFAGSSSITAFDDHVTGGTAHVYTVRAVVSGHESSDSPRYVIAAVYFTDDPQLKIRAVDITDLRKAVNAVRAVANGFASCPPYTFTDSDASLPSSAVKGLHIQQLRDALGQARTILGMTALSYTYPNVDPATNGGQQLPILHDDVVKLRGGVQ